ncbi:MAG: OmpA family protein [Proteobacteria bacterium]|nr:OmpA family protein [Pseudomonadota bacterium]MBU1596230.1 OmpA family protein [Pseudomonadota bacterium]
MSMRKRLLSVAILSALAVLMLAAQAPAETMKPKVDNFILFVDHSGSMGMTNDALKGVKIKLAKELATKMNAEIPELGYQSGVSTFAPFATQLAPTKYTKPAVAGALSKIDTDYEIYGRNTPMGMGLMDLDAVLAKMSGKTALIMFTDGDSNYGTDPVAEAKALYAKYPDRLCIHVVSYADNARGKMVVDEIRAISRCSVVGDPAALGDNAALKKYVRDVFYDVVDDTPRSMAPVKKECETITLGNMNFGFDKFAITPEMEPALEQALAVLKDSSCKQFVIEGHTDSVGTVPYNQKLSERRAASVVRWLQAKGFDASRLVPKGMGKLAPKFDNKTDEGRALNRRVEIRSN